MSIHPTGGQVVYHDTGKNARNLARPDALPRQPGSAGAKAEDKAAPGSGPTPSDAVEISPKARAAAADARTYAIGSGYSSAGKSFDQVKQEMRALFDVRSRESGVDFSKKAADTGDEALGARRLEVFGDITDRRALFAVKGDTTGLFTEYEKMSAAHIVGAIRDKAVGAGFTADPLAPYRVDVANALEVSEVGLIMDKRTIDFYDQASPEEKATWQWVQERAAVQRSYESNYEDVTRYRAEPPTSVTGEPMPNTPGSPWWKAASARLFEEVGNLLHVGTGDAAVDAVIRMLVDGIKGKSGGVGDSPAYDQARASFARLLNTGHEFTYKILDTTPDARPDTAPGRAVAST